MGSLIKALEFSERAKFDMRLENEQVEFDGDCEGVVGVVDGAKTLAKTLAALEAYTPRSLDVALALTGGATVLTYVAYTLDSTTRAFFNSNHLWLTAPFVCFGIYRFLLLVSGRAGRGIRAESPTQEMLRDVPLVLSLVAWVVVVVAIVYQLRPSAQ